MKYCAHCGKELLDEAEICMGCGCKTTETSAPALQLKTNRGLLKYILLNIITLGIYGLVASICNLTFDPAKEKNIGYFKS